MITHLFFTPENQAKSALLQIFSKVSFFRLPPPPLSFYRFFFRSKWKLLLGRIHCYYLKNGAVPLRPQSVNTTTKKLHSWVKRTTNEKPSFKVKVFDQARNLVFFPLSSTFYFDFTKKTKTLVRIISCLQFPSSLSTFIITTYH